MATHLAGQCNPEASSSLDLSLLIFQKLNEHLEQFVLGNFRSNTGTQLIDVLRYHIPDSPRTVHGTRLNDGEHKLELLASWQHLGQGDAVLTSQQPAREQSRVRMQLGAKGGTGGHAPDAILLVLAQCSKCRHNLSHQMLRLYDRGHFLKRENERSSTKKTRG